jgi:phospholipase C
MDFSRRRLLQALSAMGVANVVGCASEEEEPKTNDDNELGFCLRTKTPPRAGPADFHGVDKIVVLCMENRSFDHYFGHLSIPRELGGEGRTDIDGLKGTETNPGPDGPVKVFKTDNWVIGDIDHEWDACHNQFNGGKNDGFVRSHLTDLARPERLCAGPVDPRETIFCAKPEEPMAFYTREHTPVYHALLDEYVVCDRWFSSVMGPTWPNRFYLTAGTSDGVKDNSRLVNRVTTIFKAMRDKCYEATTFFADAPWVAGAYVKGRQLAPLFRGQPGVFVDTAVTNHIRDSLTEKSFEDRCIDGTLPPVSFIDPAFFAANNDDHAPGDIRLGQAFVAMIYNLLKKNEEQWNRTLFIVTYDEHGSFYDHVAPPKTFDPNPEFSQLGFRVPSLVIGPRVKKRHVSKVQYDHVSILSTITRRFGITPMTERIDRTTDLVDCMDPNLIEGSPRRPIDLPVVALSHSLALASIQNSHGQVELREALGIAPLSRDRKADALSRFLEAATRAGAVRVLR